MPRDKEHFQPDVRAKSGWRSQCRACEAAKVAAGWERRRAAKAAGAGEAPAKRLGGELVNLVGELRAISGAADGSVEETPAILRGRLDRPASASEERAPAPDDGAPIEPAGEDPSLLFLAAEAVEALGALAAYALREAGHARG